MTPASTASPPLAVVWWLSNNFVAANTAAMAKALKSSAASLALGAAALMPCAGRFDMAFLLGGFGAWLLGWSSLRLPTWLPRAPHAPPGSVSRVRSAMIEMELDHDTGAMDGACWPARSRAGASPRSTRRRCSASTRECRTTDPDGVRLLEAYLDRRFPGWREHAERDADRGAGRSPRSRAR